MKSINLSFSPQPPLFFTRSAEIIRFNLGEWFLDSGKKGDLQRNILLNMDFSPTPSKQEGAYEYIQQRITRS